MGHVGTDVVWAWSASMYGSVGMVDLVPLLAARLLVAGTSLTKRQLALKKTLIACKSTPNKAATCSTAYARRPALSESEFSAARQWFHCNCWAVPAGLHSCCMGLSVWSEKSKG